MQRVGEPSEVADTLIRISSQAAAMGDPKRSAERCWRRPSDARGRAAGPRRSRARTHIRRRRRCSPAASRTRWSSPTARSRWHGSGAGTTSSSWRCTSGATRCARRATPAASTTSGRPSPCSKERGSGSDVVTSNDYLAELACRDPGAEDRRSTSTRRGSRSPTAGAWCRRGSGPGRAASHRCSSWGGGTTSSGAAGSWTRRSRGAARRDGRVRLAHDARPRRGPAGSDARTRRGQARPGPRPADRRAPGRCPRRS